MKRNQKHCFRKIGAGRLTLSKHTGRALLAALLLTGAFGVPVEAATVDKVMTVKTPGQPVTDDFDVKNCTAPAVVDIAASAAKSAEDVTHVDSKSIRGTFTVGGDKGHVAEANGIWVRDDYPGTVKLADGLHITVDSKGTYYNTSGIYLEGVEYSKNESVDANKEYRNNGNKISSTTVKVGSSTSITVNAEPTENNDSSKVFAVALENHFGYMKVGDDTVLTAKAGKFIDSDVYGFYQLLYADTTIGDRLTSIAEATADGNTKGLLLAALTSQHDHAGDTETALAQNRLFIGNNAHLKTTLTMTSKENPANNNLDSWGAFFTRTNVSIGDGLQLDAEQIGQDQVSDPVSDEEAPKSKIHGFLEQSGAHGSVGTDMQDRVMVRNRLLQYVRGLHVSSNSTLTTGKGTLVSVTVRDSQLPSYGNDSMSGTVYGIDVYESQAGDEPAVKLGDETRNEVLVQNSKAAYVDGIYARNATVALGNGSSNAVAVKDSTVTAAYGAELDGSKLTMGKNGTISVTQEGGTINKLTGVYVCPDYTYKDHGKEVSVPASTFSAGDDFHMDVTLGGENKASQVYGIHSEGNVNLGKNAVITVTAPDEREGDGEIIAVSSYNYDSEDAKHNNPKTELGDGAVLTVNSMARNTEGKVVSHVVKAHNAGQVVFDGGMTLVGSGNAIYSTGDGSSVTAMGDGRKVILGDLESADKGSIRLNLNTSDSLFRGKSIIDGFKPDAATTHGLMAATVEANDASGTASGVNMPADTELTLANGARWDMTGTSQVSMLDHENGGTVNMAYNKDYQNLNIGTYSGNNGVFRMKTDLNSQTYGDKVYMNSSTKGSHGLVQVHDESFLLGKEVTGTKHLLLITDYSNNDANEGSSEHAIFSGTGLDEGGLWDVTPTIQRGDYVRNVMGDGNAKDNEWYLTKLERKINKDTIPLMKAADNSYALYRLDIDSLRKRMGDLRFRNLKDTSGLWARDFHGAYDGRGVDSKYNGFQLGYDYAANEKSVYGFFAERNISNPKYSYGSSKDHGLSGGLYGTWLGDSGVYTDVVAKWGRDDTELHSWGGYPDSANYRTWNESLSVEFGKTFTGDNGFFFEPEAQMVFGHLGSKDYTTSRGKTVSMGSYDSAIGRLGILLGKRVTNRENPYDYYLKFSVLHEFGGERNFHLAAPDGETMDYSEDYRDTWYEAGFGGTWHINGNTSIYADAERSFGGDWHKKWQWNIGVNWQF